MWEALEGLCVPVGVVSTPGLSHKSLDFPVSQGVSSDGAPLFRSKWNRSAGGPIFRPFGTQSLSACRAQRPCKKIYGSLGPKTGIRPVGPFGNARKGDCRAISPGFGDLFRPLGRPAAAVAVHAQHWASPSRGPRPHREQIDGKSAIAVGERADLKQSVTEPRPKGNSVRRSGNSQKALHGRGQQSSPPVARPSEDGGCRRQPRRFGAGLRL